MTDYLTIAQKIACEAGDYLSSFSSDLHVQGKNSDYDFVTNADIQSQSMIKRMLEDVFPSHIFIGEEDGLADDVIARRLDADPDLYFWIVDPLDGTQNYIKHLGGYSVSMALYHGGQVLVGVTVVPSEHEVFSAERGSGAFRNEKQLHVSSCSSVHDAFFNSGIPTVNMTYRRRMISILSHVSMDSLNMRIIGSAARSMGLTAAGNFESYFELGPHPWDVAAGWILVEEAGGMVTDFDGEPYRFGSQGVIASNGVVHESLLGYIRKSHD